MRILYVSNAYPPAFQGGAELIAHCHAKTLQRQGHDVRAFAAYFCNEPTPALRAVESNYENIRIERVALCTRGWTPTTVNFHNPRVEALFDETLARFRPEVVHFHNPMGMSIGMIGQARRAGAKTVVTVHDPWGFCLKNTLLRNDETVCDDTTECSQCQAYFRDDKGRAFPVRMRNDYLRQQFDELDAIVSPSQYLARGYLGAGFPAQKTHVIGNGVDLARYGRLGKTPAAGVTRFTFLGYLGHHKGVLVLLKALEQLPTPQCAVVNFVGGGVLDERVRNAAVALADRCQIVAWGRIPNERIDEVFQQTDVLISPSIWPENQPGTILEAMATGTPVIASRLGGNIELVDHGRTGLLFEAGHASALARCIAQFIRNPSRIRTMGQAARAKVAEFSFENQAETLLGLYRESSVATSLHDAPPLILCEGDRFAAEAYRAIDEFEGEVRFALADWFADGFPPNARALWVVDPTAGLSRVRQALAAGIPVLHHAGNVGVRNLIQCADGDFHAYDSGNELQDALCQLANVSRTGRRRSLELAARQ